MRYAGIRVGNSCASFACFGLYCISFGVIWGLGAPTHVVVVAGRYKYKTDLIKTKRDKTPKRASPEKQRKTRTKQRPRAEPTKSMEHGPADSHGELFYRSLCRELQNKFEAPEVKPTSSKLQTPSCPGVSLSGCGGRAVQSKSARREANGPTGTCSLLHRDLLLHRSGCPVFCLRQAAAAKK
jgi:hypothetical protein